VLDAEAQREKEREREREKESLERSWSLQSSMDLLGRTQRQTEATHSQAERHKETQGDPETRLDAETDRETQRDPFVRTWSLHSSMDLLF
jgi:hypothetical protein